MSSKQAWEKLLDLCDLERSVLDPSVWAERTYSPRAELLERLHAPRPPRLLLSGLMGSGKSTELLRVAAEARRDWFVVYLDLGRALANVFQDAAGLQLLTAWEVCFLIGVTTIAQAVELLGDDAVSAEARRGLEAAWARASNDKPERTLDSASLGKALLTGAGAALGGLVAETFKGWLPIKVGIKGRPDFDAQSEEVRGIASAVNRVFKELQQKHRRVLVIVDGLDRIKSAERAKAVFIDSTLVASLECATLLCAPFAPHRHLEAYLAQGFVRFRLLCEPVLSASNTSGKALEPDPRGLAVLHEVFARRAKLAGLEGALTTTQLDRLALYSGGRLREFVRMLNELALRGWRREADALDDNDVAAVLDRTRRDVEESLRKDHLELLRSVLADPKHELPDSDLAAELLHSERLLVYPNESEWFFPHPLLTLSKLQ